MNEFVSTKWLYQNLNNKNLVILDCSWFLPFEKKNPSKDYKKLHIKNSYFFDINKISNQNTKLPNMIPGLKYFTKKVRGFNIHKDTSNYGKNG